MKKILKPSALNQKETNEILSKSKVAEIAFARQVAIYVSWKVLNLSYSEIGKHFGKNHTTVLYTINKMREITAGDFSGSITYLRTNRTPSVPGPQWQETVQPACVQ